ncbi:hypothetical protein PF007_g1430 [Phytophthora fragariae]|uniref:Uncharacterized protein n=1 Tax=Phytophthora fragariae TaxID=53985 RepID=A0A6A3G4K7_9STRA|nr:hypothetical protein PF009_g1556 [Phytophthora fragariae]KAE9138392.1 hypothetical protein PF007_g1430 [Phytophthora fragariae]KAE9154859.1 hypothetical protein PF006_g1130 [Phytophthora fragariae]KAE9328997.1 hypothetical protein PF001_g1143 [Phytophthora fragariae]
MPRKTKKTKFDEEAENLAALLSSRNDEDAVLAGQADFWKDFRARVAENDAAIGLESLDHLAVVILQGDESATLSGTVLLLPPPDAMQAGVAPSMCSSTLTQRRRPRLPSVQPHVRWIRRRRAMKVAARLRSRAQRRAISFQFDEGGGKSSGGKSGGDKTSSGKSGDGNAGGGSKAESGDDGGGKKTAPLPSPSGSSTPEDKPPAATIESKSSDRGGAQVPAAAEP